MHRGLRRSCAFVTFANKIAVAWRVDCQTPDQATEAVYQAYRSDAGTRTSDENGFVEETRRIEERHCADVPGAESIPPKYIRCKPVQQLSATMGFHSGHREVEEDVQLRRWNRLLSWLRNHGMDLSPSGIRVERRPRTGIFHFLFH